MAVVMGGHSGLSRRSILCPIIVGRREEVELLTAAIEHASRGTGGVVLITGEAGIGKSRLAREAAMISSGKGLAVLWGRAVQQAAATPFRALTEAISGATRQRSLPDAPELKAFRPALSRIVPDPDVEASGASVSPAVLGEGVLRFLRAFGRGRACLLVLEDLHWADLDTLSIVEYLSDNVAAQSILCVATIRSDEPGTALSLVRRLRSRRTATELALERLTIPEVAEMAAACLAGREVAVELLQRLHERSEGVPLLVEELLTPSEASDRTPHDHGPSLQEEVPSSFADIIRARVSMLSDEAQLVIRAAAVLGRSFDWHLLPSVTGLDDDRVGTALREAVATQLVTSEVRPHGDGFRFRHALTRDAIVDDLLSPQRTALALKAATTLESAGIDDDTRPLVAHLLTLAGDLTGAARHLLEAGRTSVSRGALATAESALRSAKILATGDEALLLDIEQSLVQALALAGKTDIALQVGEALLDRLQGLDSALERRAEVHVMLARAGDASTRWRAAGEHLKMAARYAQQARRSDLLAQIMALDAHIAMGEGRHRDAMEIATSALEAAKRYDQPQAACEALEVIGRHERGRDLSRARAAFERAMVTAREHGLEMWFIRAQHEVGVIDAFESSALDQLLRARDRAYRAGALSLGATVDLQLAGMYGYLFDPESALDCGERCVDLARSLRWEDVLVTGLVQCAFAHAVKRRAVEMDNLLAEATERFGERPDIMAMAYGHCRAMYSLLSDNGGEAQVQLDSAMSWLAHANGVPPFAFRAVWALLRTVESREGDKARREVTNMEGSSIPLNRAIMGYADAVALGRLGRGEDARQAVVEAEGILRGKRMHGMRHLMRRLTAEAALEDSWGNPIEWLSEASMYFDSGGYFEMVRACRSLLRTAGAPVSRRRSSTTSASPELARLALTDREVEVLGLVGERLSNKEIAARLYISFRTVEKHVERLLAKSGLKSRSELAGLARRTGVLPTR